MPQSEEQFKTKVAYMAEGLEGRVLDAAIDLRERFPQVFGADTVDDDYEFPRVAYVAALLTVAFNQRPSFEKNRRLARKLAPEV